MVLVTGADGRTTRLSPDGKKIKDENTNVERKTRWEGGRLVSEINGLGRGKMTADVRGRSGIAAAAHHRRNERRRANGSTPHDYHVYDADPR